MWKSCENPWLQCGMRNTTCCHTIMSSLSSSNCSLWLKGPVDASMITSQSTQKKAQAKWTTNEKSELLAFRLKGLSAATGDGENFTKKHSQPSGYHSAPEEKVPSSDWWWEDLEHLSNEVIIGKCWKVVCHTHNLLIRHDEVGSSYSW